MNLIPSIHQQPEPSLRRSVLGWLMRIANRHPLHLWYENKTRLIVHYGENDGFDLQTVEAPCWQCSGQGERDYYDEGPADCPDCDGTGIHHRTRTILRRYLVGSNVFHQIGRSWYPEDYPVIIQRPGFRSHITGRVKHRPGCPYAAREAIGLMMLLCGCYRAWWGLITAGAPSGTTTASFPHDHPSLKHPQHLLAWALHKLRRVRDDEDIPF